MFTTFSQTIIVHYYYDHRHHHYSCFQISHSQPTLRYSAG